MPTFRKSSAMPVDAATLFEWHARPGALQRLLPPWQPARIVEQSDSIRDGARVVMDLRLAPLIWKRWVAEHFDFVENERFRDRQVTGPFKAWTHTHRMIRVDDSTETNDPTHADRCAVGSERRSAVGERSDARSDRTAIGVGSDAPPHSSVLSDEVEYELPVEVFSRALMGRKIVRELDRMFAFRHARTANDLARHATFADRPRQTIAISGASGAVASRLIPFLTTGAHTVRALTRSDAAPPRNTQPIGWNPQTGVVDESALGACDILIHLAGKNIATRWTEATKQELWKSRVDATRKLCETLAKLPTKPRTLIAASAVGIYGDRGDEPLDESSPPGDAWISELGVEWERATQPARDAGIRVVNLRIAPALAADSGALAKMLTPTRLGIAGPVGGGRQFMPWIAMDDLVYLIHHALMDDAWSGPINAVTASVRQSALMTTLGRVLRRPTFAPLPAIAVKTLFGQMGREVLLASENVQPSRLNALGFVPTFATLEGALRFELGRA